MGANGFRYMSDTLLSSNGLHVLSWRSSCAAMNSQAFERPVNKLCCKCDLRRQSILELKGWYTNQHDDHQNYHGFHHCHLHQNYLLSSWSLSTCRFWHLGSEHLEGDNVDKHYPDWAEIILLVFSFWNFQSILFMFWFSLFCSRSKLGCSSEKMIEWVKNCENEIGNA